MLREGRLREPAARPHMPRESRRVVVVDGLLAAVRHDLDDTTVRLQPHPHHGQVPITGSSAIALADSPITGVNGAQSEYPLFV